MKPGKAPELSKSYRPISLLCPAVKVLERLLLPSLSAALTPTEHQHGFRRKRSTVTAMLPLVSKICDGMKQPKPPLRTAVIAVDISQAFDRVMIFSITANTPIKDSLLFACFLMSLRTFHQLFHRWTPATHTHPHFYHPSIGPSEHCKMSAQENWDLESSDSETESEAMERRER